MIRYFGTWRESGHYWFNSEMRSINHYTDPVAKLFHPRIDGEYYTEGKEGVARLTHELGFTVISFPDRSVDKRGGSHSTFVIEGTLDFDAALSQAQAAFPRVFHRFTFQVVPAAQPSEMRHEQSGPESPDNCGSSPKEGNVQLKSASPPEGTGE